MTGGAFGPTRKAEPEPLSCARCARTLRAGDEVVPVSRLIVAPVPPSMELRFSGSFPPHAYAHVACPRVAGAGS